MKELTPQEQQQIMGGAGHQQTSEHVVNVTVDDLD